MAMLAEPRKKQKFSSDPRNLNWSQDENRFGKKLMERMGWQKGKGLGANEDGHTEHIAVQIKNDTTGIGCTKDYADNWVAHQHEFNALLSSLNSTASEKTKTTVQNLEEVSKSLKGRIHYKRFARGKDLTNAKSEDLNCIFGKRKSKSAPSTPQYQSETNTDEEDESDIKTTSHGITTIKSSTSVQDYFKEKLAAMKAKNLGGSISAPVSTNQSSDEEGKEASNKLNEDNIGTDGREIKTKKHKKSKKSKHTDEEQHYNVCDNNSDDDMNGKKCKKKKKKKHKKKSDIECPDHQSDAHVEVHDKNKISQSGQNGGNVNDVEDMPVMDDSKRKKKKKKKEKGQSDDAVSEVTGVDSYHDTPIEKAEAKVTKRKQQVVQEDEDETPLGRKGSVLCSNEETSSTGLDELAPRKKRKELREDEVEYDCSNKLENSQILDNCETNQQISETKTKRKKVYRDGGEKFSKNPSKYFKGSNLGNVPGYGR